MVFVPFLCVGIPLILIGVITILAEGGAITKPEAPRYRR
jgi:hypothetical protein